MVDGDGVMTQRKKQTVSDSLQKTQAALQIKDVRFDSYSCELLNDFDPMFDDRVDELTYQTRMQMSQFELIRVDYFDSEDEQKAESKVTEFTLKVTVDLGVRLGEKGTLSRDKEEPDVLVLIQGKMSAYYSVLDNSIVEREDALEEFSSQNAPFHIWPYWREFVSSSLSRFNLRKITLPYMKKASNRDQRAKTIQIVE